MLNMVNLTRDYIAPTHALFDKLLVDGAAVCAYEEIERAEKEMEQAEAKATTTLNTKAEESLGSQLKKHVRLVGEAEELRVDNVSHDASSASSASDTELEPDRNDHQQQQQQQSDQQPPVILSRQQSINFPIHQRQSILQARNRASLHKGTSGHLNGLCRLSLPLGVENLPVEFELVRSFFGSNPCQILGTINRGDESLEIKGTNYWADHINKLRDRTLDVQTTIATSLEEKRNFFSFILTVVTVGLAPMTILTGYWYEYIINQSIE